MVCGVGAVCDVCRVFVVGLVSMLRLGGWLLLGL